ncbi:hypothetical protein IscW_ISCW009647 [Ixodes scapularis]|uniref:Uncharacterized protein n=1 Tax=Ixodes scapularis TaxID=6945 RepID=B7Q0F8_IXOSC|nr:hypothetical protein IscW_ISCW009647 [Ixodes scapularis]|eukprot:XP_002407568.1 hypothetical protein IscW_ISCW009647 [Ixodes scapularis]
MLVKIEDVAKIAYWSDLLLGSCFENCSLVQSIPRNEPRSIKVTSLPFYKYSTRLNSRMVAVAFTTQPEDSDKTRALSAAASGAAVRPEALSRMCETGIRCFRSNPSAGPCASPLAQHPRPS